jgi:hypothetical protein
MPNPSGARGLCQPVEKTGESEIHCITVHVIMSTLYCSWVGVLLVHFPLETRKHPQSRSLSHSTKEISTSRPKFYTKTQERPRVKYRMKAIPRNGKSKIAVSPWPKALSEKEKPQMTLAEKRVWFVYAEIKPKSRHGSEIRTHYPKLLQPIG